MKSVFNIPCLRFLLALAGTLGGFVHASGLGLPEPGRDGTASLNLPRQLTTSTYQDFQGAASPDGQWLAFVSDRSGNLDLWLRSLGPGDVPPERPLTESTASDSMPCWSPDGESIVYCTNGDDPKGDIAILHVRTGKVRLLTDRFTADSHPAWSPDGRSIAYASAAGEEPDRVLVLDLKSGASRPLTPASGRNPAFSPDGEHIVFDSAERSPPGIWVARADGRGPPRPVAGSRRLDILPCFSGDGKSLLFVRFQDDTNGDGQVDTRDNPSLWSVPFDAAGSGPADPFPLTSSEDYSIFPSPWGRKVIYTSSGRQGLDLWALPEEGLLRIPARAEEQLAMARRLEGGRPPAHHLALMAYRRCVRDFASDAGAALHVVEARYRLAQVLLALKNDIQAEEELRTLLANRPGSGIFTGLAELALASIRFEREIGVTDDPAQRRTAIERGVAAVEEVFRRHRDWPEVASAALLAEGQCWLRQRDDQSFLNKALDAFGRVLSDYPNLRARCAEALFQRAAIYEGLGSDESLAQAYLAVPQSYPAEKTWCTKAAARILDIVAGPDVPDAERVQKLRDVVEQQRDLSVLPALAQNQVGDAFYRMLESAKAKRAYEDTVRNFPAEPEQVARAQFALAQIYYQEQNYEKTLEMYSQIQEAYRTGDELIYRLARERFIQRKLEKAERHLTLFREPQAAMKEYLELAQFDPGVLEAYRGQVAAADVLDQVHLRRQTQANPKFKDRASLEDLHPNLLRLLSDFRSLTQKGGTEAQPLRGQPPPHAVVYVTGLIYTYFDPEDYLSTAIDFLRRSIALDAQVVYPHQTLGFCLEQDAQAAGRKNGKPDRGLLQKALEEYLTALALNDEEINEGVELGLHVNAGNCLMQLGEARQAYDHYARAFRRFRAYSEARRSPFDQEERCLVFLQRFGEAAFQRQQLADAEDSLRLALEIARRRVSASDSPDRRKLLVSVARTADRLALSLQGAGKHEEAARYFLLVRDLNRQTGHAANEAKATRNAAYNLFLHGRQKGESPDEESLTLALQHFEEALRNVETYTDPRKTASDESSLIHLELEVDLGGEPGGGLRFDQVAEERLLYTYIGKIYEESLDYEKAIEAYRQKLSRYPEKPPEGQAAAVGTARAVLLNQLGYFHFKLGRLEDARRFFEQALSVAESLGTWPGVLINAANLGALACHRLERGERLPASEIESAIHGMVVALQGAARKAPEQGGVYRVHLANQLGVLHHFLARSEWESVDAVPGPVGTTEISRSLAALEHSGASLGYFRRALQFLQGREASPDLGLRRDQCAIHFNMAQVAELASDAPSARESLALARETADRFRLSDFQWKVRYRAALLLPEGEPAEGLLAALLEAIGILESAPPLDPFPAPDQRLADALYRRAVELMAQQGRLDEAFRLAERAQEQPLVAAAVHQPFSFRSETYQALAAPLRASLESLREIRSELASARPESGGDETSSGVHAALQKRFDDELARYRQRLDDVARDYPEMASLFRVGVAGAEEIQQLIAEDNLVLKYFVAGKHLLVWALTSSDLTSHVIPWDPALLPAAAAAAAGGQGPAAASSALAERLLGPVAAPLSVHRRVYLIADPALAEVPWESLAAPGSPPLHERAELAFLSSANAFFFSYFKRSPHKKTLLLAGPAEATQAGVPPAGGSDPFAMAVERFEAAGRPAKLLDLLHQYHAVQLSGPIDLNASDPLATSLAAGPGLRRFGLVQAARAIEAGRPYSIAEFNPEASSGALVTLAQLRSAEGFASPASVGLLARALTFAGFPSILTHVAAPGPAGDAADPEAIHRFLQEFYRLWRDHSAGEALRQAQDAAARAGVPASVWGRFRLFGHLGLDASEALEFAQTHWEQTFQAAWKAASTARDEAEYAEAVRYFENALSLVEIRKAGDRLPTLYRNLAIASFKARLHEKAILYGGRLVDLMRQAGDDAGLAQALFDLGVIHNEAERYEEGIRHLEEAASLFQKLGRKVDIFSSLGELGKVQQFAGQYLQAIQTLQDSMKLGVEVGDEAGVGTQLRLIGAVYYRRLNQNVKAAESFQKALDLFRRRVQEGGDARDRRNVARCLIDLGLVHERRADWDEAARLYREALDLARALGDSRLVSEALLNLANTHWFRGEYQKAFELQRQALEAAREARDPFREQAALNTAGLISWTLNDPDRAREYLEAALALCHSLPGTNGRIEVASTRNNLGLIDRSLGRFDAALDHFQRAREIDEALRSDWGLAYDERNIGVTCLLMDKPGDAASALESAALRSSRIGDTTSHVKALYSLGEARLRLGETDASEKAFEQALDLSRRFFIREIHWRAEQGLGRTALARGQPAAALEHFRAAIDVVEQMRAAIKIEEFKNGFATDKLGLYEDIIIHLLDQGQDAEALDYCERSRARNFIDLLGNQRLDLASRTDAEFLQKQASIRREIAALEEALAQAPEGPEKEAASQAVLAASRRHEDLLIDMRLKNPQLSSFVSVNPLKAAEIQKLLEPGVTLLEILATPQELVAWIIRPDAIRVQRIPCRLPDLRRMIQDYRRLLQSVKDVRDESRELHDLLLKPILPLLEGTRYLGIIPHDHLHYLSFASLTDGDTYLVEKFPIFYAPSASVLRFSLDRRNRPKNQRVLAVGNPDLGNEALALPFAEKEVENIHWDFPEVDVRKGQEATEKILIEHGAEYGIIHVASHGEFDAINPLLSRILLARDEVNDGNLQVEEVFRLTLQADLVVLSACQSGLGKLERGDEIIGLNRAFTYAGTHSLLSTLWRVSDVSTAILVKHFYRNYASLDKAASLRKAQLQVMRFYPHPAYWSAFVLTGDYR
ncbi:MAG: CHAT domain-containing protein [Planctomycetes bacterium]|nr:CHAT domain-containing protein [Planctomycetota bacterium]